MRTHISSMLYRIAFLSISIIIFLFSCKKENSSYPSPEVSFINEEGFTYGDTSVSTGDTIMVKIIARSFSDNPLTLIHIERITENDTISIDTGIYDQSITIEKRIVKSAADTETWTFTASDRNRIKSYPVSLKLINSASSSYGEIKHIPSVILGFQNNNSTGSFYSFLDKQTYNLQDAFNLQQDIHLTAYYDYNGDDNVLASPGANIPGGTFTGTYQLSNWSALNNTRYVRTDIPVNEFDNCTNDSLIYKTTFAYDIGKSKAKNLKADDIYAFVSDKGFFGLIKIKSVTGTNEGSLEFEVKMK